MRIGRTLPPAAAPLRSSDLCHGLFGMCSPEGSIRALEESIRQYFSARHVFLVSSGKAALTLTLMALKAVVQADGGRHPRLHLLLDAGRGPERRIAADPVRHQSRDI